MKHRYPLLPLLFLALLAANQSQADTARTRDGAGRGPQPSLSKEQAARIARERTGGRVLSAQPAPNGFRVKVLTPKGEVRYVPVRPAGR